MLPLPATEECYLVVTSALSQAVAAFGAAVTAKSALGEGQPEAQLLGPADQLIHSIGEMLELDVTSVWETPLEPERVRPDFGIRVGGILVGHVELKAPGKGADPTKFARTSHDGKQWVKNQALANLIYSDGNEWSLWREGQQVRSLVRFDGDVRVAGENLDAPSGFESLIKDFLLWAPSPPATAGALAKSTAKRCALLRSEILELLADTDRGRGLKELQADWRRLLYPDASDERVCEPLIARVRIQQSSPVSLQLLESPAAVRVS